MNNYSTDLLDFLNASPVNFFAVKETARRLEAEGYRHINAEDRITDIKAGDKIFVTKNDSTTLPSMHSILARNLSERADFTSSVPIPTPQPSASSQMQK